MDFYPDNQASHYFTKLPQTIQLSGDYEVGLSEIQFSNTYLNVNKNDCQFTYISPRTQEEEEEEEDEIRIVSVTSPGKPTEHIISESKPDYQGPTPIQVSLSEGLYDSNEQFIEALNTLVRKKIGFQDNNKSKLKFYYNRASKKVSLHLYETGSILYLSSRLQRILGQETHTFAGKTHQEAQYMMDLNEDFKSVYVYCDLVAAHPVGDVLAPLLRIVPSSTIQKEELVHRVYEKPHYFPLSRYQFNAAEMLLKTDTGKTISFSSGSTVVTLHFRRKRPTDY